MTTFFSSGAQTALANDWQLLAADPLLVDNSPGFVFDTANLASWPAAAGTTWNSGKSLANLNPVTGGAAVGGTQSQAISAAGIAWTEANNGASDGMAVIPPLALVRLPTNADGFLLVGWARLDPPTAPSGDHRLWGWSTGSGAGGMQLSLVIPAGADLSTPLNLRCTYPTGVAITSTAVVPFDGRYHQIGVAVYKVDDTNWAYELVIDNNRLYRTVAAIASWPTIQPWTWWDANGATTGGIAALYTPRVGGLIGTGKRALTVRRWGLLQYTRGGMTPLERLAAEFAAVNPVLNAS